MTKQRTRETIEYYNTCKWCGNEFQVYGSDSTHDTCHECETKFATDHVKERLLDFIGAKVTCIEPVPHGRFTSADELESIEIELADGRRILFSIFASYEDSYIQWETRQP